MVTFDERGQSATNLLTIASTNLSTIVSMRSMSYDDGSYADETYADETYATMQTLPVVAALDKTFAGLYGNFSKIYSCCTGKGHNGDINNDDEEEDEERSPKVMSILDASTSNEERDGIDKDDKDDTNNDNADDDSIAYYKPKQMSIEELESRFLQAKSLLVLKRYTAFVNALRDCQELLSFRLINENESTLLHVLASQDVAPPDNVILQTIAQDPAAVNLLDGSGNSLLHCAAKAWSCASNLRAFFLLLKFCRTGATQQNADGDLPLHIVAASGSRGAEKAAGALLEVNPTALTVRNSSGKIPLHLAFTEGSGNTKCLTELLVSHKEKKISVSDLDDEGNSPLHSAIKYCAPYEAISTFREELDGDEGFLSPYLTKDRHGNLPLHCALKLLTVDSRIISLLLNAAPFTGGCENAQGEMPVQNASSANLPPDIVIDLLKTDMPIEMGNKNGHVVEREHGHSWWHVAIQCKDRFSEGISELLEKATYAELVGLAQSTGPDGKTLTIDAAPTELKTIFHDKLRFLDRYDISTDVAPYFDNNLQIFFATDTATTESLPMSKAEEGEAVTLRCYSNTARDELFQGEIDIRKNHHISSTFVEDIKASYKANRDIVPGAAQVISFARPKFTLQQLLEANHKNNLDWLTHCRIILRHVAQSLQHLHNCGIVHGHLEPSLIGNFGSWKLMEIGRSTTLGSAMSGEFRRYAPPESVVDLGYRRLLTQKKSIQIGRSPCFDGTNPTNTIGTIEDDLNAKGGFQLRKLVGLQERPWSDSVSVMSKKSKKSDYHSFSSQKKRAKLIPFKSSNKKKASTAKQDFSDDMTVSDRIISVQEEEITRLRHVLADKERELHLKESKRQARNEAKKNTTGGKPPLFSASTKPNHKQENENAKRFAPEKCMASPAWDAFAMGEIMAQLFLSRSLALPVYAGTNERVLNRLSCYDEPDVDIISQEVRAAAGDLAADLVSRLLDPSPSSRLSSMSKVLCHRYFHDPIRIEVVGSAGKAKKSSRNKNKKSEEENEMNVADSFSIMTP